MELEKVYLNLSASERLNQLCPEDNKNVLRVLSFLRDDAYRSANKTDLIIEDKLNKKTLWGIRDEYVFVSFIELDDGRVMVSHWSIISNFRPPLRPRYQAGGYLR